MKYFESYTSVDYVSIGRTTKVYNMSVLTAWYPAKNSMDVIIAGHGFANPGGASISFLTDIRPSFDTQVTLSSESSSCMSRTTSETILEGRTYLWSVSGEQLDVLVLPSVDLTNCSGELSAVVNFRGQGNLESK